MSSYVCGCWMRNLHYDSERKRHGFSPKFVFCPTGVTQNTNFNTGNEHLCQCAQVENAHYVGWSFIVGSVSDFGWLPRGASHYLIHSFSSVHQLLKHTLNTDLAAYKNVPRDTDMMTEKDPFLLPMQIFSPYHIFIVKTPLPNTETKKVCFQ